LGIYLYPGVSVNFQQRDRIGDREESDITTWGACLKPVPAQGALYFRCTGHQVFWGKVRRSTQEAALTTRLSLLREFKFLYFKMENFFLNFLFEGHGDKSLMPAVSSGQIPMLS
jgi:hypothetical protein